MGTCCAPLVADLFLCCYERNLMLSLSDNNQTDIIEDFNSTSRYLDDLRYIDNTYFNKWLVRYILLNLIVGHPEPEKKSVGILSTFWHPCSKCILMCLKKDRGRCQVSKCPKVPELGQRSTEFKFLYIRQILAFLSISYPKWWLKVMQNLFWIIQPCYINKRIIKA